MKRKIAFLLALLMAASVFAGCGGSKTWTGKHEVEITVNNYGTFRLEVDADSAPQTASQFLNLAKKGFYNDLTIYRAIEGFAIYGGCPNKNGTGKASSYVEGEFTSNGFNNPLSMTRGAIGMARGTDKNSGTCQFFILQNDATYLDGDFAVFGYVVSGMDIVDQIAASVQVTGADGFIAEANQPVITSVKVFG